MTTTVAVTAHCSADKEVIIAVFDTVDGEPKIIDTFELQNGETKELYAYDLRQISVQEVLKEGVQ